LALVALVEQTTLAYLAATATTRCSAVSRQPVAVAAVGATPEAIWLAKTAARAVAVHSPKLVVLAQSDKATTVVLVTRHRKVVAVAAALVAQVATAATRQAAHKAQAAHQALLGHQSLERKAAKAAGKTRQLQHRAVLEQPTLVAAAVAAQTATPHLEAQTAAQA
jgi:hypothetical protein